MIGVERVKKPGINIRARAAQWGFLGAVATLLLGTGACDIILDFSATQCQKTEECRAKGPNFAETLCVQGVCTVPSTSTPTGTTGSGGDTNICQHTEECVNQKGGYYRCLNSRCVPLLSEDCKQILGNDAYKDDNAIFFGLMSQLTGTMDFTGEESVRAVELALDEFDKFASGGLLGGPNNTQRPLAYVVCDERLIPCGPRGTWSTWGSRRSSAPMTTAACSTSPPRSPTSPTRGC